MLSDFLSFNDCEVIFHKLIYEKSFSKGNYANIIFQSQSSIRMSYHDNDLSRFCFHTSSISLSFIRLSLEIYCNKQILHESFPSQRYKFTETWNPKIFRVSHFIKNDFLCNHREKPTYAQHSYSFLDGLLNSPIIIIIIYIYFNSYLFLFNRTQTHIHIHIMLNFTHNKSLIWNHYNLYEHVNMNEIEEIVWCWYDVIVSLIFSDSHDAIITPCIISECCRDDGYVDEYFESD